jgi:hypothetical protein
VKEIAGIGMFHPELKTSFNTLVRCFPIQPTHSHLNGELRRDLHTIHHAQPGLDRLFASCMKYYVKGEFTKLQIGHPRFNVRPRRNA